MANESKSFRSLFKTAYYQCIGFGPILTYLYLNKS